MIGNKMKVKVYFNLHKKLFSVVAMEGDDKGRVIAHVNQIELAQCVFRVQQAGRKRVLREGKKNVHAYIAGHTCNLKDSTKMDGEATYNPYKYSTFVDREDGSPVGYRPYCKLVVENNKGKILTLG